MKECRKAYFDIDEEYRYSWTQVEKAMEECQGYRIVRDNHLKYDENSREQCTDEEVRDFDQGYRDGFKKGCEMPIRKHNDFLLSDWGKGKIINLKDITSEKPYEGFYDSFFLFEIYPPRIVERIDEGMEDEGFQERMEERLRAAENFRKVEGTDREKIYERGYKEGYMMAFKYMSIKINHLYSGYVMDGIIVDD